MQGPIQSHNSTPVVLRASFKYLISASDKPPLVYLKNLRRDTKSIRLETRVSAAAVCAAAFHPRRLHVFMLAFRDGAVAMFNAVDVTQSGRDGEMGHMLGSKLDRITDCAFLPQHKSRAVTVGLDGRCRLLDLEAGTKLRTWHAKAPMTSVSVCGSLIAVGRVDGRIDLYDSLGFIQAQCRVDDRVISLEWGHGPSPPPIPHRPIQHLSDAPSIPPGINGKAQRSSSAVVKSGPKSGLGLPPALRRPMTVKLSPRTDRKFTVHPDEVEQVGTVRHLPSGVAASAPEPKVNLPDLFSSRTPTTKPRRQTLDGKKVSAPFHQRPRISSKTFAHTVTLDAVESHATSTSSATARNRTAPAKQPRRISTHISPLEPSKTKRFREHQQLNDVRICAKTPARQFSLLNVALPNHINPGTAATETYLPNTSIPRLLANTLLTLSNSASGMPAFQTGPAKLTNPSLLRKKGRHKRFSSGPAKQKVWHPGNVLERESTWPTDSIQDPSLDGDEDDDDAWQTDDTDVEGKRERELRERSLASLPLPPPPSRLTSHSRATMNKNFGTAVGARKNVLDVVKPLRHLDGSTGSSGAFQSARTHFSPEGWFTPASEEVRDLFPRSSSLSHRNTRYKRTTAAGVAAVVGREGGGAGATAAQQAKTPWVRARAKKMEDELQQQGLDGGRSVERSVVRGQTVTCVGCASSAARLASLEGEVTKLKGDVAEMKTALQQAGIVSRDKT